MAGKKSAAKTKRKSVPQRTFRCDDDVWSDWQRLCRSRELTPSAGIRILIKKDIRKARAEGELRG